MLLFDQNISFRLVNAVKTSFPAAKHISDVGLTGKSDLDIWRYAQREGYTIVTFDSDFVDISNLRGHPPKIIYLRFGNTATKIIAQRLETKQIEILQFLNDEVFEDIAILVLNH